MAGGNFRDNYRLDEIGLGHYNDYKERHLVVQ